MGFQDEINKINQKTTPSAEESLNEINLKVSTQPEQVKTNELIQEQIDNSPLTDAELRATPVPVSATDLDIRNLSQSTDGVAIYGSDDGGTTKRIIKTDSGGAIQVDLEVANVTITNGAGASAVNIQDGGNSITVDGSVSISSSALPTGAATASNQTDGSQKTKITDGAGVVNTKQIGTQLTNADVGLVTNSMIHGFSSAGGGTIHDVKVTPSGAMNTETVVTSSALPTGASTSANQTTANNSLSSIDTKLNSQATAANQTTTNTNLSNIYTRQADGNQKSQVLGAQQTGSYPDPSSVPSGSNVIIDIDKYGNLQTRGEVLTDELSYRDDFTGNALSADWVQTITGGGSIAVASSLVTLSSSTANANITRIEYPLDYGPLTLRTTAAISQRIANQTTILGFTNRVLGVIEKGAYIRFTGTNNRVVDCVTQFSSDANDVQTTSNITLPASFITAQQLYYKIDISNNTVTFQVSNNGLNYTPLAQHTLHIPGPYDPLNVEYSIQNSAIVTNTTLSVDLLFVNNMNRLQIDQDYTGEPIPSQLIGQVGNVYKNVNATQTGELKVEIGGNNISAFGDLNTAELNPIIQIDFVYGILTALGTTTVVNAGTAGTNAARLQLQSGTNIAGSSIYQTVKVAKYRPAQGIDARFTAVFDTGVANNTQEVGMGDTSNGYFFGYVGTQFGIIYRNGGVQTFIAQQSWNVDPCDGTSLASFTLNPQTGNAYKIKYPYQGYANIKFFIFNPNTGNYILVHQIQYANAFTAVQLTNPNLPFWARSVNTGNNTNKILYVGSVGVFLSGVRKYLGQTSYSYNNKALTTGGGLTNLFTIKNATTFNTVSNKSLIRITSVSFCTGNVGNNAFGYLFLIKNATVGGTPAFTAESGTTVDNGVTITNGQSPASIDVAGTTVSGGISVWGTNGIGNSNAFLDISQEDIFIAPGETLTFAGLVTANGSLSAVLNKVLDI